MAPQGNRLFPLIPLRLHLIQRRTAPSASRMVLSRVSPMVDRGRNEINQRPAALGIRAAPEVPLRIPDGVAESERSFAVDALHERLEVLEERTREHLLGDVIASGWPAVPEPAHSDTPLHRAVELIGVCRTGSGMSAESPQTAFLGA